MSSETNATPAPASEDADVMAAEWAAALAESKPETASELHAAADQISPASFQNFSPETGNAILLVPSASSWHGVSAVSSRAEAQRRTLQIEIWRP